MAEAATPGTKTQSWRPLVWGLAAFLACPFLPFFEALFPVQQTLLLLVPIVAAGSIVGWKLGGRISLTAIWIAFSIWILFQPAGSPGTQYDQMARGWAILLAASFGLVSLWSSTMPFFSRGLFSVGLAAGIGFLIALSSPSGIARFQHAAGEELTRRVSITIEKVQEGMNTPEWRDVAARVPALDSWNDDSETLMRAIPARAASLLPALLALESLAALALGWGVLQRLSPVKIGPALSPLTEFRFNDQLVWGRAVGATLCLLPAFEEGRTAGYNLLLFFGAVYLIRGIGVLAWIARGRYAFIIILSLIPQVFVIVTFALGLGDTWLDIRKRVKVG
ncbi:MAG: hypothetical protein NVS1B5_06460 [Gemmatimonadaceae bacterium]